MTPHRALAQPKPTFSRSLHYFKAFEKSSNDSFSRYSVLLIIYTDSTHPCSKNEAPSTQLVER